MAAAPEPIAVSGGAGGIEAHCADLTALARLFGRAATDTRGTALTLHRYLGDVGFGLASVLDPGGSLEFEAALLLALDGPGGVSLLAAHCAALDLSLRAAVAGYTAADHVAASVGPDVRAALDFPDAVTAGFASLVTTGDLATALQVTVTSDPAAVDVAVDALGGPRGRLAAGAEALLLDGHPVLRVKGADPQADAAGPPRSFADLVAGLARRNAGEPGEIDVRRLTGADGQTCYIVDIPGTKSWSPLPGADVTSLATNVRAIAGGATSYQYGVLAAMRAAGVTARDKVMLVGHSEGGMVALDTATACARSGQFTVTNVVTAGAPLGAITTGVPSRVTVLAIENSADVVAHLDGRDNAPAPNVTTVTIHHNHGDIGSNHDLHTAYLPGAVDVDRSADPSVRAYWTSAIPFLSAATVATTSYVVTRGR